MAAMDFKITAQQRKDITFLHTANVVSSKFSEDGNLPRNSNINIFSAKISTVVDIV